VRIESGQLSIRKQVVALRDVIQGARELVEPLLEQRGQRLVIDLPADLPTISGDEQRLIQVVVNLLANASKFGPANSEIRIGAKGSDFTGVSFWVDDEGTGPSNPHDDALFEQFRRSGGEDPQESGLGLGLFIVRSIVERHGGRASLSRRGDSGTRALIELPCDALS
jgi:signal transduction histidine kinase